VKILNNVPEILTHYVLTRRRVSQLLLITLLVFIAIVGINVKPLRAIGVPYPVYIYVPPTRTISVDGYRNDWSGVPPRYVDPKGDLESGNDEGADLASFYLAKDESFLYVMIETYDTPSPTHNIILDIDGENTLQIAVRRGVGLVYI
jgi:hypothetical protein